MTTSAKSVRCRKSPPAWHDAFMEMVPAIETHAKIAFRHLDAEAREEAIQEVICNACCAYARLVELKKTDLAYPSALARFGVAQTKDGRKVGGQLNCRDVLSDYCQQKEEPPRGTVGPDLIPRKTPGTKSWSRTAMPDLPKRRSLELISPPGCNFCLAACGRSPDSWPTAKRPAPRPRNSACRRGGSARSERNCSSLRRSSM